MPWLLEPSLNQPPPSPAAAPERVAAPGAEPPLERTLRLARRAGWALLGLQLAGMLALSTVQYSRDALTNDFGAYAQAWWAIAHGHLDPFSTLLGRTFWRNNAEFAMWPLALLYYVLPHPIGLLWLQDAVVVLTELVTFHWVLQLLQRARGLGASRSAAIALAAAVAMVANPWAWETVAFDVHLPPLAALFAVLIGRDLWAGRTKRLWCWVPLALLVDLPGALYVVGVGIGGLLASRRTRRHGAVLIGAGILYLVLATRVLGAGGYILSAFYGYLVGPHSGAVGILAIAKGIVLHPATALRVAGSRWAIALDFLLPVGVVGVVAPWGLGMALVVLGPAMLARNLIFFRPVAAFQIWPALPFVLVASVLVLVRVLSIGEPAGDEGARALRPPSHPLRFPLARALRSSSARALRFPSVRARRSPSGRARHFPSALALRSTSIRAIGRHRTARRLGLAGLLLWAAVAAGRAVAAFSVVPATSLAVDAAAGRQLATIAAQLPPGAEVVASNGVVGRFSERRFAYHFDVADRRFPVRTATVYFVIAPHQGLGQVPPAEARAVRAYLTRTLGGRLVVDRAGVYEVAWRPGPHVTSVALP